MKLFYIEADFYVKDKKTQQDVLVTEEIALLARDVVHLHERCSTMKYLRWEQIRNHDGYQLSSDWD